MMQPMLPVAMTSGDSARERLRLACTQALGDLGLQDVVEAGRTAAQVSFLRHAHFEAGLLEQSRRGGPDPLAML